MVRVTVRKSFTICTPYHDADIGNFITHETAPLCQEPFKILQ